MKLKYSLTVNGCTLSGLSEHQLHKFEQFLQAVDIDYMVAYEGFKYDSKKKKTIFY